MSEIPVDKLWELLKANKPNISRADFGRMLEEFEELQTLVQALRGLQDKDLAVYYAFMVGKGSISMGQAIASVEKKKGTNIKLVQA